MSEAELFIHAITEMGIRNAVETQESWNINVDLITFSGLIKVLNVIVASIRLSEQ